IETRRGDIQVAAAEIQTRGAHGPGADDVAAARRAVHARRAAGAGAGAAAAAPACPHRTSAAGASPGARRIGSGARAREAQDRKGGDQGTERSTTRHRNSPRREAPCAGEVAQKLSVSLDCSGPMRIVIETYGMSAAQSEEGDGEQRRRVERAGTGPDPTGATATGAARWRARAG